MSFNIIDAAKKEFPVQRLCSVLGVSQSGYFSWKSRPASRRQGEDMILMAHIRARFSTSHETYGAPRMHVELKEDGLQVGRHRVARLMRENGLKALQKRRYKKTTDSSHGGPVAANLLDQDFGCDGPDQKWGADISYIWTAEGWLYLAIVLDLYSRRIVGWATSDRLKKDLALRALRRANSLAVSSCGPARRSVSRYCLFQRVRLDNPIPKSSATCMIVRPLVSVSRTASHLKSSVNMRRSRSPIGSSCCVKRYQKVPPLFPGKSILNAVEAEVPAGKAVHVILDNYAAHKHPKVRQWLDRHERFTFHFTPTSCSWLNAVEGFFATLTKRRLKRGVFRSIFDLQSSINRFLKEHNMQSKPFVWTADPEKIIAAVRRGHQMLDSIH